MSTLPEITPEICRARALAALPELADASFRLLGEGFDALALLAGERWVLKFPKHPRALASLRRETAVLDIIRPVLAMPVPDMVMVEAAHPFSRHEVIPGAQLLPAVYETLSDRARQRLAERLAEFFAGLHALPVPTMRKAGATDVAPWLSVEEIQRNALPLLPDALRQTAVEVLAHFTDQGQDPLGDVFGHFDTHGWNMAFDPERAEIEGIYDFGDSGIGPLHRDFVCTSLIAADLTDRIIPEYEVLTGKRVDRARIWLLTAVARLSDLAEIAPDDPLHPLALQHVGEWLAPGGIASRYSI